jgi:hypothetical protein
MNKQTLPKDRSEGSNREKILTVQSQARLSGQGADNPVTRIFRPGADNPAPQKDFLTIAAAYTLIDRGRKSYNMIHGRGKQQLEGQTPRICKGKINPRVRKIPASIAKMAW